MRAYRIETILSEDGRVTLNDLPFELGQRVEIIVLPADEQESANRYPLRGQPYRHDDPFGPLVAPQECDAIK